jgi:drug/metabolite transporter (DMT)-like permease
MPQLPDRVAGALLVTAACLCWSSGGILVRLLDLDAIVIVFWRSLFMAMAVALGLLVVHREAGHPLSSPPFDGQRCCRAFCSAAHSSATSCR